jgi:phospholipase C
MITRRNALKRLGAMAGAAAVGPKLIGCGDNEQVVRRGITHFVEICMENRSYDHWLGARKLMGLPNAGDGLTADMSNKRKDGSEVQVYPAETLCVADPPHSWGSAHLQWNGGAMDGFLTQYQESHGDLVAPDVMQYMTGAQLPWTWALAEKATVCDRWFSSIMGPTWPNRLYLHSAQSGGLKKNEIPAEGFNWQTVYHLLNARQIPWTYYWSDLPVAGLFETLVNGDTVQRIENFFDACERGTLPPVSIVEPAFTGNDDHPPHHPMLGQQFLASVYTALANSPHWNNVLIVITYDEQGGFFDHVPPPTMPDDRAADGFDQLGFRVPTIVAGPYAKQGYTSSLVYEHASVPKHIETMFGLSPLGMRDAAARDLSDCIDLERLANDDPAPPLDLPPIMVDESMIDAACYKRGPQYAKYAKTEIEQLADTGYFGEYDRRGELGDVLELFARVLEKHGKGGIRRGTR